MLESLRKFEKCVPVSEFKMPGCFADALFDVRVNDVLKDFRAGSFDTILQMCREESNYHDFKLDHLDHTLDQLDHTLDMSFRSLVMSFSPLDMSFSLPGYEFQPLGYEFQPPGHEFQPPWL